MEVLGALDGIRMIAEPFNVRLPIISRELNCESWAEVLNESSGSRRINYLHRIETNHLKFLNPNPFIQRRFFTTRSLYKIIHLPTHIAFDTATAIDGKFLCLLRHPIPVSLSRKVFPILEDFDNSSYRNAFTDDQLKLADYVIAHGSHLEKGVMAWCLHFQPFLRSVSSNEMCRVISYEDCVANTEKTLNRIERMIDERFPADIRRRALTPSRVLLKSDPETQAVLRKQNNGSDRIAHLVGRWQENVSDVDLKTAQSLLDSFGVSLYRVDDPFPQRTNAHN